ncbi:imelysin family protein (plasmid) [Pseudoalteromonas sp. T1lg65]|uniref:imelysin family protein n=1 Tax=Pseudoalteromonas sp. T1lg65 TaxID=2077101 RepID=UPI003F7A5500
MKSIKSFGLSLLCVSVLAACSGDDGKAGAQGPQGEAGTNGESGVSVYVTAQDVVNTNAQHAYAVYADSLIAAKALKDKIDAFVATPSERNFADVKQAWLQAREPYGQSEVYRFREGPIDALTKDEQGNWTLIDGEGPEGAINAWPLAEALIDYTVDMDGHQKRGEAAVYQNGGNIIADQQSFPTIDKALLKEKFELNDEEANVTSGYHAIEFLLWGQDLNEFGVYDRKTDYTAGHRPVSDFYTSANTTDIDVVGTGTCTSGEQGASEAICARRGQYLQAAAELLVEDLQQVADAWKPGSGFHYLDYTSADNVKANLGSMLESMGRLSFGELAGERISIAVRTDSQEDEHSCFSDNTHRDIFLNAKGVQNHFLGTYVKSDGEALKGASIYDLLVVKGHHELANKLRSALENTMASASVIDTTAKMGTPFDVQIQKQTHILEIKNTIEALASQTDLIQEAIEALEVTADDLKQDTEEQI